MDLNETRERIIYEKEGPIARVTLNWPEKANAQDQKLAEEVDAALLDADRDYDIKVLILKANGKGFCSGHAIGNNAVDYPSFVEAAKVMGTPWKPQTDLFVKDSQHAMGAAAAVRPFLEASPAVLDVAGGTPQIASNFFAP